MSDGNHMGSEEKLESKDSSELRVLRCYQAGDSLLEWMRDISKTKSTPGFLLRRLASSSDTEVKIGIADHSNTPLSVLEILAKDENPDVRFAVAENHNINERVLQALSNDHNPYVAFRAQKTLNRVIQENPHSKKHS